MLQQRRGVGGDMLAVRGGATVQCLQVTHRVGGDLAGQIGRVGASPTGFLVRVDLDQLAA